MDYDKGTFVTLGASAVQAVPAPPSSSQNRDSKKPKSAPVMAAAIASRDAFDYDKGTYASFGAASRVQVETVPSETISPPDEGAGGSRRDLTKSCSATKGYEYDDDDDAPTEIKTNTTSSRVHEASGGPVVGGSKPTANAKADEKPSSARSFGSSARNRNVKPEPAANPARLHQNSVPKHQSQSHTEGQTDEETDPNSDAPPPIRTVELVDSRLDDQTQKMMSIGHDIDLELASVQRFPKKNTFEETLSTVTNNNNPRVKKLIFGMGCLILLALIAIVVLVVVLVNSKSGGTESDAASIVAQAPNTSDALVTEAPVDEPSLTPTDTANTSSPVAMIPDNPVTASPTFQETPRPTARPTVTTIAIMPEPTASSRPTAFPTVEATSTATMPEPAATAAPTAQPTSTTAIPQPTVSTTTAAPTAQPTRPGEAPYQFENILGIHNSSNIDFTLLPASKPYLPAFVPTSPPSQPQTSLSNFMDNDEPLQDQSDSATPSSTWTATTSAAMTTNAAASSSSSNSDSSSSMTTVFPLVSTGLPIKCNSLYINDNPSLLDLCREDCEPAACCWETNAEVTSCSYQFPKECEQYRPCTILNDINI